MTGLHEAVELWIEALIDFPEQRSDAQPTTEPFVLPA